MILSLYQLFFVLTISQSCNALIKNEPVSFRIVGGKEASIMDAPFMASLQRGNGRYTVHVCGAVIVTKIYLLTAAHCLVDISAPWSEVKYNTVSPKLYAVSTGNTYAQHGLITGIKKFFVHEDFDFDILFNDFGAIALSNDLKFDRSTQPAKLPEGNFLETTAMLNELAEGRTECDAFGWGATSARSNENILKVVGLHLVKADVCQRMMIQKRIGRFDEGLELCTMEEQGVKDACQGDSGGPLSCDGVVWGLVSWGQGCARPGIPSVFARTDVAKKWLEEEVYGVPLDSASSITLLRMKNIILLILNVCFILRIAGYLSP